MNKKLFFLAIAVLFLTWIVGEPPGAPLDEIQHSIYASSVARGHFLLPITSLVPIPVWGTSTPEWLTQISNSNLTNAQVPTNALIPTTTRVAHLPPFYYFFVGIPTLFKGGLITFFSMRLISALMSMLYIGYALSALFKFKRGPLALAGFFLALTPETYFLSSTVNPNGTEIVASAALWVFTALLITSDKSERPQLYKKFAIVAGTLCLMRTLSPLWVLIAGVYILIGLGIKDSLDILKFKKNIKWSIFAFIGGTATFIWDIFRGQFPYSITFYLLSNYQNKSFFMRFLTSVGRSWLYIDEAYNFTNLHFSEIPAVAWTVLTFGLVALALIVTSKRFKIISLTTVVASVIVPSIVEASQGGHLGLWWWGNYSSPLYVTFTTLIPILIFNDIREKREFYHRLYMAVTFIVVMFIVLSEIYAFYEMIKIFMVGINGKIFVFNVGHSIWSTYSGYKQDVWLVLNLFSISTIGFLIIRSASKFSFESFSDNASGLAINE